MSILDGVQHAILSFAHTGVMVRTHRRDDYEAPRAVSADGLRRDGEDRVQAMRVRTRFTSGQG